jgi:NhaP-type Na+/H+ or K+/H+ antiporter
VTALVVVFGIALLLAVITSALASRSPLSSTTVFLGVGLVAGPLVLDAGHVSRGFAEHAAELALFAILFTDGQHAPWHVVRRSWGPPTRALVVGMPLTFVLVTVLAHWLAGLPWAPALVLGAILSPTDPVFASALVGREDVQPRVRHMLNIESGLNDGIALPVVLALAGAAGGHPRAWSTHPAVLVGQVFAGVGIGLALPLLVFAVLRLPGVGAHPKLQPLGPLALAVLLWGVCDLTSANRFLAAFVAGATIATVRPQASESFRRTGELASEALKGAALLAFAALLDRATFATAGVVGIALAALVIVVARPVPVMLVLRGSALPWKEQLAVAWFGPKGFASVAYAIIALFSGMRQATEVFALTAIAVLLSVVAHSSTDVAVAGWLDSPEPDRVG